MTTTRTSFARRILRSRLSIAVTAAAVTASVLGGVAYAAVSPLDPEGVIHACYSPTSGAVKLRTAGTCAKTLTPIDWNRAGALGPQGVQGPAGPAGAQGPAGGVSASDVTTISGTSLLHICFFVCASSYTTVAEQDTMPAGAYLVHADLDLTADPGTPYGSGGVRCVVGTTNSGMYPWNLVELASTASTATLVPDSSAHLAVNTVVTLKTPGPLGVYCPGDVTSLVGIHASASMTAQLLH